MIEGNRETPLELPPMRVSLGQVWMAELYGLLRKPWAWLPFPLLGMLTIWIMTIQTTPFRAGDIVAPAICFLMVPSIALLMALSRLRREGDSLRGSRVYRFDDEGMRIASGAVTIRVRWDAFLQAREQGLFLELHLAHGAMQRLPRDQLEASGLFPRLKAMLAARVPHVAFRD